MPKILSWEWQDHAMLSSTNDFALSQKDIVANTIISAKVQTDGRGRLGNKWQSIVGNLFFTQIIADKIPVGYLTFISSLSIAQTCISLGLKDKVSIKWPNDVLLSDKKFCGILIEQSDTKTVIGIGVNLCSHPKQHTTTYQTTDLLAEGIEISREQFLQNYLKNFDINYNLCCQDFAALRSQWLLLVQGIDSPIIVKTFNKTLFGIFKGIDEKGLLLLEQEDKIIKIAAGEVFLNTEQ